MGAAQDGLCASHHRRREIYGICKVRGCDKAISRPALGWCEMHYYRQYRHGSVDVATIRPRRVRRRVDRGYVRLYVPDHPLANGGWVYEHRLVLYEVLGPAPQECWWCGVEVRWGETLQVDHLDADRSNNDAANLVPSCQPCNQGRGTGCDPHAWSISMAARRVLRRHAGEFTDEVERIRDRLRAVPDAPRAPTNAQQLLGAVRAAYDEAYTGKPRGRNTATCADETAATRP